MRGSKMEEKMKVLTLTQLLRLTRSELFGLLAANAAEREMSPEGSVERHNAEANLHKIRWAIARGDFMP